ncbi:hypothetical protein [Streptomyces nigrescens]
MATHTNHTALSADREQEIRESHPGDWYAGEWRTQDVDSTTDEYAHYVVKHRESGQTLATLPDWAGPIALFIADAHDAVPELLAEIDRLRKERDELASITANARKLASGWSKSYGAHISISQLDAMKKNPYIAGMQEGSANQYSDCANELRDVLGGEDPDVRGYGISVEVTASSEPT